MHDLMARTSTRDQDDEPSAMDFVPRADVGQHVSRYDTGPTELVDGPVNFGRNPNDALKMLSVNRTT